jgi:hypothetical protein
MDKKSLRAFPGAKTLAAATQMQLGGIAAKVACSFADKAAQPISAPPGGAFIGRISQ